MKLDLSASGYGSALSVVLCVSSIASACIVSFYAGSLAVVLVFLLLLLAAGIVLILTVRDGQLRYILFLAVIVRLALLTASDMGFTLPDSDVDAAYFEERGWAFATNWTDKGLSYGALQPLNGTRLYSLVVAVVYYAFGRFSVLPCVLNMAVGVVTIALVYRLAIALWASRAAAQLAAGIGAVFPTLVLYSVMTLREALFICAFMYSLRSFLNWMNGGNTVDIIKTLTGWIVAVILHAGAIPAVLVYAAVAAFYSPRSQRWTLASKWLPLGLVMFFALAMAIEGGMVAKLPKGLGLLCSPEYLCSRLSMIARSRAAYLSGIKPSSYLDIVLQTPLRVLYFLFAPFPHMVSNTADFIALADGMLYVVLVVCAIRSVAATSPTPRRTALLLVLILTVVVFAWGTSNYGTAVRHRQKIVPLLLVISSPGIARSWLYRGLVRCNVGRRGQTAGDGH